ncbi:DUF2207 domain-containing protein [Nonomuraea sp. NPDC000554]|uniref:DUF2207 domain-containing protein n=1 Tax=Nonomuraea sp. NPDC000554 TaxID=3154259 RepID=UPI0033294A17
MRGRVGSSLFVLGTLVLGLAAALPAMAGARLTTTDEPRYTLPNTVIAATVRGDGTVSVVEDHTFQFTDEVHGAYVDVPMAEGTRISDVTVAEGATRYQRGGEPELGAEGPDGTYAEAACTDEGPHRVVWHFTAAPRTSRTFRLAYTLNGAVTAYDRHAFLHLPVWGRNWLRDLDRLQVTVRLAGDAGGVHEAFGQPAGRLKASFTGPDATATAVDVPPGQAVALDLAFPRARLDLPGKPGSAQSPVVRRDGTDGSADLATLRAGGSLRAPAQDNGCDPATASAETDNPLLSFAIIGIMAVLVLGIITLAIRHDRRAVPRRRRKATGSDHGSQSGSDAGGGSASSDGSGGGGGAW